MKEQLFLEFADNLNVANVDNKPRLVCEDAITREVYRYLHDDLNLPAASFDSGFPRIDYSKSKKTDWEGVEDSKIQCEEVWEKTLKTLDIYGEMAGWKEDDDEAQNKSELDAIRRYQKFRKFVETITSRPIPWVPEAPTVSITPPEIKVQKQAARKIRSQIYDAIQKLKQHIDPLKTKRPDKYNQAFLIGLYAFVSAESEESKLAGVNVAKIPSEIWSFPELKGFVEYLKQKGGLGMWDAQKDAKVEGTLLQTISGYVEPEMGNIVKKGWCTEKAKVLYGVLRMAGFNAFFVEPHLPIDYFAETKRLKDLKIPLQGHMASGVAVTLKNQKGKEEIWIMDMAMGMVHADYIEYPHWQLSLRHYWMADLSNLGLDQMNRDGKAAQESFELALRLGKDSTAYLPMSNYSTLMEMGYKNISTDPVCSASADCIQAASKINPQNSIVQYHLAMDQSRLGQLEKSLEYFLNSIDLDPRFPKPFQKIGELLRQMSRSKNPNEKKRLEKFNILIKKRMDTIRKKHPFFQKEIEKSMGIIEQILNHEKGLQK